VGLETQICKVAIVDDDQRIRESINDLLASAGLDARTFNSAVELLQSDELKSLSCLITDVRMEGIDGWELQRLVVAARPQLPIVIITAHQDDMARSRALALGAFDFIYKPFDGEELLDTVTAAINQYHDAHKVS
jgi:FixJ family two-component response regulator